MLRQFNLTYLQDRLCFFFFKQKTAYEMRISDWSSDVCSSDLVPAPHADADIVGDAQPRPRAQQAVGFLLQHMIGEIGRESCRERVCQTCRSRWSPYH